MVNIIEAKTLVKFNKALFRAILICMLCESYTAHFGLLPGIGLVFKDDL